MIKVFCKSYDTILAGKRLMYVHFGTYKCCSSWPPLSSLKSCKRYFAPACINIKAIGMRQMFKKHNRITYNEIRESLGNV